MQFLQTEPGAEPVILEAVFPASRTRVFQAWTDPEQIMKWVGAKAGSLVSAEIDVRIGGRWCFVVADNKDGRWSLVGEYTEIDTNTRLQFTWRHVREVSGAAREETPNSTVTVTFNAQGAATRVRLHHESILREDGRRGVGTGWEATFVNLNDLLISTS